MVAAVALVVGGAALMLPASWMTVSAAAQPRPAPVALRTASNNADEIVAPGVVVSRQPVGELPEAVNLLLVGAALVGLAGLLRRERVEEPEPRGAPRSHIPGVVTPRRGPRAESPRRAS